MKVICLKKPRITNDGKEHPSPEVGDIDLVVNEKTKGGRVFYVLERFDEKLGYLSTYFATFPDTPAEVIEEEEPEMVTV